MDPILTKLNQAVLEKALPANTNPVSGSGTFQQILDTHTSTGGDMSQRLLEYVDKSFGNEKIATVTPVDANNINLQTVQNVEVDKTPKISHLYDIIQDINKDQVQLENFREKINSGKPLTYTEGLNFQIFASQSMITFECLNKGVEQVQKLIQTSVNTQIG